jgi:hypothetical protein
MITLLKSQRLQDYIELLHLSLRVQLGRRFYFVPMLCLLWPIFVAVRWWLGDNVQSFDVGDAQNYLVGFPITVLSIALGIQIISSEIEQRTLEVCYTVPGGAIRIWFSKLVACIALILVTELVLALIAAVFFTTFPVSALYGAFQGALFYLILAMSFGGLFGNKLTSALVAGGILFLNGFLTNFGDNPTRYSPLFNPLSLKETNAAAMQITAWTIQNRVGVILVMLAILVLTVSRADRRELMLSKNEKHAIGR